MSAQGAAKAAQGYRENIGPLPVCSNCAHYAAEIKHEKTYYRTEYLDGHRDVAREWTEEKNKRCTLGGFAVKKQATCSRYQVR